jgi:hypothetical protein
MWMETSVTPEKLAAALDVALTETAARLEDKGYGPGHHTANAICADLTERLMDEIGITDEEARRAFWAMAGFGDRRSPTLNA